MYEEKGEDTSVPLDVLHRIKRFMYHKIPLNLFRAATRPFTSPKSSNSASSSAASYDLYELEEFDDGYFSPASFPSTPFSRSKFISKLSSQAESVMFVARDRLRQVALSESRDEFSRETALKGLLATFDADYCSDGIDLCCGNHCAVKVRNLSSCCSCRALMTIPDNVYVYVEFSVLTSESVTIPNLSVGLAPPDCPLNVMVGNWARSVGLCTDGTLLVSGKCHQGSISRKVVSGSTVGMLVLYSDLSVHPNVKHLSSFDQMLMRTSSSSSSCLSGNGQHTDESESMSISHNENSMILATAEATMDMLTSSIHYIWRSAAIIQSALSSTSLPSQPLKPSMSQASFISIDTEPEPEPDQNNSKSNSSKHVSVGSMSVKGVGDDLIARNNNNINNNNNLNNNNKVLMCRARASSLKSSTDELMKNISSVKNQRTNNPVYAGIDGCSKTTASSKVASKAGPLTTCNNNPSMSKTIVSEDSLSLSLKFNIDGEVLSYPMEVEKSFKDVTDLKAPLRPTVSLLSAETKVWCRFSESDIVHRSREEMGAPSGVRVYCLDGTLLLSEADE